MLSNKLIAIFGITLTWVVACTAQAASGSLPLGGGSLPLLILGEHETQTALEEATVRATLDSSDATRRGLKGRLTIKDASKESRRFLMQAVEVFTAPSAPQ